MYGALGVGFFFVSLTPKSASFLKEAKPTVLDDLDHDGQLAFGHID